MSLPQERACSKVEDAASARHVHMETINFTPTCRSTSHTKYTGKQLTDLSPSRINLRFMRTARSAPFFEYGINSRYTFVTL